MVISEIVSLIDELSKASKERVEEIVTILEVELSNKEIEFPAGKTPKMTNGELINDSGRAYEYKYITEAREIIMRIRGLNGKSIHYTFLEKLKFAFTQTSL